MPLKKHEHNGQHILTYMSVRKITKILKMLLP